MAKRIARLGAQERRIVESLAKARYERYILKTHKQPEVVEVASLMLPISHWFVLVETNRRCELRALTLPTGECTKALSASLRTRQLPLPRIASRRAPDMAGECRAEGARGRIADAFGDLFHGHALAAQ